MKETSDDDSGNLGYWFLIACALTSAGVSGVTRNVYAGYLTAGILMMIVFGWTLVERRRK